MRPPAASGRPRRRSARALVAALLPLTAAALLFVHRTVQARATRERLSVLEAISRELASAEYVRRSAGEGDAVALLYLPAYRRRLCAELLRAGSLGIPAAAPLTGPEARRLTLLDAFEALRCLRLAALGGGRAPDDSGCGRFLAPR